MPPASNVREVLAALEPDTGTTVAMPLPRRPAAKTSPASSAGATAPVMPRSAVAAPEPPPVSTTPVGTDMSDSQVLRVLERRGSSRTTSAGTGADGRDIALLSPQDTQTWSDIKAQIKRDAVVHFAVQLHWSVTPIELGKVPALAIFNSYTLYKIEGNREGRKWYGLRLGFFSDALAAKQVAHYVRSEFAQVAVVPVGVKEREQAKQIGAIALPASSSAAARPASARDNEITLIEDKPTPVAPAAPVPAAVSRASTPVAPAAVAARPAVPRPPASTARRPNRPRGAPQSLEETLEILGASQLSIDTGRGERVVIDGRPRRLDPPASTFSKLLDRLGEKLRK